MGPAATLVRASFVGCLEKVGGGLLNVWHPGLEQITGGKNGRREERWLVGQNLVPWALRSRMLRLSADIRDH